MPRVYVLPACKSCMHAWPALAARRQHPAWHSVCNHTHTQLPHPPTHPLPLVCSGRTAVKLLEHYRAAGAASVALVSLLSKPARREVQVEADYTCFEIEDKFVVG